MMCSAASEDRKVFPQLPVLNDGDDQKEYREKQTENAITGTQYRELVACFRLNVCETKIKDGTEHADNECDQRPPLIAPSFYQKASQSPAMPFVFVPIHCLWQLFTGAIGYMSFDKIVDLHQIGFVQNFLASLPLPPFPM